RRARRGHGRWRACGNAASCPGRPRYRCSSCPHFLQYPDISGYINNHGEGDFIPAGRWSSALTVGAPERDPLPGRVGADRASADGGPAASAGAPGSPVDPGRPPRAGDAREGAIDTVAVGADGSGPELEQCRHVDLRRRRRGEDSAQEQQFCRVLVAEPCDVALIEQRDVDAAAIDRKSTRLNSSHVKISYAVF